MSCRQIGGHRHVFFKPSLKFNLNLNLTNLKFYMFGLMPVGGLEKIKLRYSKSVLQLA